MQDKKGQVSKQSMLQTGRPHQTFVNRLEKKVMTTQTTNKSYLDVIYNPKETEGIYTRFNEAWANVNSPPPYCSEEEMKAIIERSRLVGPIRGISLDGPKFKNGLMNPTDLSFSISVEIDKKVCDKAYVRGHIQNLLLHIMPEILEENPTSQVCYVQILETKEVVMVEHLVVHLPKHKIIFSFDTKSWKLKYLGQTSGKDHFLAIYLQHLTCGGTTMYLWDLLKDLHEEAKKVDQEIEDQAEKKKQEEIKMFQRQLDKGKKRLERKQKERQGKK